MTKIEKLILLGMLCLITAGTLALCYGAYQNQQNRIHEER